MVDFGPVVGSLFSAGLALLIVSIYLMNRGEKYRKDWQDEVDQLAIHRLHALYIDFIVQGGSEIGRLSQMAPDFTPIQTELSSRIAQGQRCDDLRERLDGVFGNVEISFSNDKHLRDAIGSLAVKVEKYQDERRLFKNSWESEVKLGRSVAKIAILFFLAAVSLVPVLLGADSLTSAMLLFLNFLLVAVGGGLVSQAGNLVKTMISSRDTLQDLIERERFGVSGVEDIRL